MSDQQQAVSESPAESGSSATRALALLNLFSRWRRPAGARELAVALGMPRSSTNVLLRALVTEGYLRFDGADALYYPSFKVAQLGLWLSHERLSDPAIGRLVQRLSEATRETVCLWARSGNHMRILALRDSPQAVALALRIGDMAPVFHSAVGLAHLSALDDGQTRRLIDAHNRTAGVVVLDADAVLAQVEQVRREGLALAYGRWIADAGALAMPLPGVHVEPIVVAVGGPAARIRDRETDLRQLVIEAVHAFSVEQNDGIA